jgi:predicted nucleic acid-binding protein
LHKAEFVHAVEQSVFRQTLSPLAARAIHVDFQRDRESNPWLEVDLPQNIFEKAVQLARAHIARLSTRTLDTLHVAAALELGAKDFWTFDDRQAKLATAVGFSVM